MGQNVCDVRWPTSLYVFVDNELIQMCFVAVEMGNKTKELEHI
jgi:hypothetical protein